MQAVTGSGKTLAFLLPVLEKLLKLQDPIKKHHIGAIIISPTRYNRLTRIWAQKPVLTSMNRELAQQIHAVLLSLLGFHAPSAAALKPPDDDASEISKPAEPISPKALKVVPQLLLGGTRTPAQDLSAFLKTSPNLLVATPGRLIEILSSPHVHCPQSSFEVLVLDEGENYRNPKPTPGD
jgi:ATP-dependent RNA helicase DDX55/SPB4